MRRRDKITALLIDNVEGFNPVEILMHVGSGSECLADIHYDLNLMEKAGIVQSPLEYLGIWKIKLTARQKAAIEILKKNPGLRPVEFAEKFWPDSDGWKKPCRCGPKGSRRGAGMALSAGGFLGKLERKGLVRCKRDARGVHEYYVVGSMYLKMR